MTTFTPNAGFTSLSFPSGTYASTELGTLASQGEGWTFSLAGATRPLYSVVGNKVYMAGTVVFADLKHVLTFRSSKGEAYYDTEVEFTITPGAQLAVRYVRDVASGTGSGATVANCAAISSLNSIIAATLPDGDVRLLPPSNGTHYSITSNLVLSNGAPLGSNIIIRSVAEDGTTDALHEIRGNRDDWTPPVDPETVTDVSTFASNGTSPVFRLNSGANRLVFRNLRFRNCGDTIYIAANNVGLRVQDCEAQNVRRFVECASGVTATNVEITDCAVDGFSRECIRFRGDSNDILISGGSYNSHRQSGDAIPGCIVLLDTAHNLRIEGNSALDPIILENCHYDAGVSGYWQGDGVSAEGSNYNIRITDAIIRGHTDGGVDIKASDVIYTRVAFSDNKRNARIWGNSSADTDHTFIDYTFIDCTFDEPNWRGGTGTVPTHIWFTTDVDIWIEGCTFDETDAAARVFDGENETAAVLRLVDYTHTGAGTLLDVGAGTKVYDPADTGDVVAPTFTTSTAYAVTEETPFSVQLTASEADCTFRMQSGDDEITVSQTGLMDMAAVDYEGPTDEAVGDDAALNNTYVAMIRVRDAVRNETTARHDFVAQNLAGDTGGSVSLTTTHGWRLHNTDSDAAVTLSGTEYKTATRTAGTGHRVQRGSFPAYPPVNEKIYWEGVPATIGDATQFAMGFANYAASRTANLGANNHSVGYFADGRVVLNGATLATYAGYAATDVIGFALHLGKWDHTAFAADTTKAADVHRKRLRIFKNGVELTDGTGLDCSALVGEVYAALDLYTADDSATVRSEADEWTQTPPTGFGAWGTVQKRQVQGNAARYVSPTGTGPGTSWANAAPLSALSGLMAAAAAGGAVNPTVFILADAGYYNQTSQIDLSASGLSSGNRVTVLGVSQDLVPMPAIIYGSRTVWALPSDPTTTTNAGASGWSDGGALFNLKGCDHATFSHLFTTRVSQTFYLATQTDDVLIEDCGFYNNRRGLIESVQGSTAAVSGTNFLVRRFYGTGHSKPAVHFRGLSNLITVEDGFLNSGLQQGDDWPTGVKFSDEAHHSQISRVWAWNMKEVASSWTQGDGIEINNGNEVVNATDCVSYNAGDAGIDSKSDGATYTRCIALNGRNGMRMWGDQTTLVDCVSYQSTTRHAMIRSANDAETVREDWVRFIAVGQNGSLAINTESDHVMVRFIDGAYYATPGGSSAALSTLNRTADGAPNGSLLFTASSDNTAPVITSASSGYIHDGRTYALPLAADSSVSWEFDATETVTPLWQPWEGALRAGGYAIINPYESSTAVLRYASAAYDATTGSNNTKTVKIRARDGNNNLSSAQTHTLTIKAAEAFPSIDTARGTSGNNATNSTTASLTLPATVVAGEWLVAILAFDGNPTLTWDNSTAGTWTQLSRSVRTTSTGVEVWTKVADGTEGGKTLTITLSASEAVAWRVLPIANVSKMEVFAANSDIRTSHDPAGKTGSWTAPYKAMGIGIAVHDNGGASYTAPTGTAWTFLPEVAATGAGGVGFAVSYLTAEDTTSFNPPAWTCSASEEVAHISIAVQGDVAIATPPPPDPGTADDDVTGWTVLFNDDSTTPLSPRKGVTQTAGGYTWGPFSYRQMLLGTGNYTTYPWHDTYALADPHQVGGRRDDQTYVFNLAADYVKNTGYMPIVRTGGRTYFRVRQKASTNAASLTPHATESRVTGSVLGAMLTTEHSLFGPPPYCGTLYGIDDPQAIAEFWTAFWTIQASSHQSTTDPTQRVDLDGHHEIDFWERTGLAAAVNKIHTNQIREVPAPTYIQGAPGWGYVDVGEDPGASLWDCRAIILTDRAIIQFKKSASDTWVTYKEIDHVGDPNGLGVDFATTPVYFQLDAKAGFRTNSQPTWVGDVSGSTSYDWSWARFEVRVPPSNVANWTNTTTSTPSLSPTWSVTKSAIDNSAANGTTLFTMTSSAAISNYAVYPSTGMAFTGNACKISGIIPPGTREITVWATRASDGHQFPVFTDSITVLDNAVWWDDLAVIDWNFAAQKYRSFGSELAWSTAFASDGTLTTTGKQRLPGFTGAGIIVFRCSGSSADWKSLYGYDSGTSPGASRISIQTVAVSSVLNGVVKDGGGTDRFAPAAGMSAVTDPIAVAVSWSATEGIKICVNGGSVTTTANPFVAGTGTPKLWNNWWGAPESAFPGLRNRITIYRPEDVGGVSGSLVSNATLQALSTP